MSEPISNRLAAIIEIAVQARADYNKPWSNTSAKRLLIACNSLALNADETRQVFQWLEYCDEHGEPYKPATRYSYRNPVKRIWP